MGDSPASSSDSDVWTSDESAKHIQRLGQVEQVQWKQTEIPYTVSRAATNGQGAGYCQADGSRIGLYGAVSNGTDGPWDERIAPRARAIGYVCAKSRGILQGAQRKLGSNTRASCGRDC